MNPTKVIAIDTQSMPWEERFNERIGRALFRKELYTDPETGALIRLQLLRTPSTRSAIRIYTGC